ncbi:MAG TPA: helix-hairpin-helix domain-containing protein [Thermodesulfovibrionales bacterium]|jgi:general secretion pathway protein K|nr:helix-hairpin-helix domain-containing protein [Thermodesulfovibrionales bacterium]
MHERTERGIALLLVLWVMTVLMVIVLSFSFITRTETQATVSFKEGIQKRFIAEAGIERGIAETFYRRVNKGQPQGLLEGMEVWKTDGTPYSDNFGDGYYTVSIMDESGKFNINTMNDANAIILKQLLTNLGVGDEDVDTIVDSILDWKDADDLRRLNGAESDYYMSLPNPYKAKNANFDTLEELLLVKGVTPQILYGDGEKKGLIEFITISPGTGDKINVNAASKELMAAVPGMTPELADAIIAMRQDKEIMGVNEIPGFPQQSQLYLLPVISNSFSIEAVGYKGTEKTGHPIKATIFIESNNKFSYLSYKSPAKVAHE